MKRFLCLVLSLLFGCALFMGCAEPQSQSASQPQDGLQRYSASWFDVFDTVTVVVGYAESEEAWNAQMDGLHNDLQEYHKLYDIYHVYEGVTSLRDVNRDAASAPVVVDVRLFDMLVEAKAMYLATGGQMNIAMGQMLRVWHDYREQAEDDPAKAAVPPMELLSEKAQHSNIDDLVLDENEHSVFFSDPELKLDVGSIGKGYAVEMVAQAAEKRGLTSALISVGGNLRSIGAKPDGSLWSGGIQDPWGMGEKFETGSYLCAVNLDNESLVTSGNYQRFYEIDGVRYHHLIDPDTLFPANVFSAVAVLAPDSGFADCLSTGLYCMSLEEGRALVATFDGVEAMWMLPDGEIVYSPGFEAHIKPAE